MMMVDWEMIVIGLVCIPALLAARHRASPDDLDALFARLSAAQSAEAARAIVERIWEYWLHHENPEVCALMEKGIGAVERQHYEAALDVFGKIIERDPDYAEGWNKRATVRYLQGNYAGSVRDIKRVLALEPRHFGALSGLGIIYLLIANDRGALDAFEAVLALNPHLNGVRRQVEALRDTLNSDGQRGFDDGV
jgi:tetratricopeptide (TPR) repeat protein